jgi:hypothetical protein
MEATYTDTDARRLIEKIAEEIRPDALKPRFKRSVQLILGSFASEHIVTELLQNADDVGATTVDIILNDEGIFFIHNGKDFDEADLRALCDIGETTKKPGIHIGFMGVGFKAAFKVTDTPYVFSGPFRFYFKREDVIVPYWVSHEDMPPCVKGYIRKGHTTIFLPFRKDLPAEIIEVLNETLLKTLEPLCLVFLKSISKIRIIVRNASRNLTRTIESLSDAPLNIERVSVIEKNDKEKTFEYLVFRKALQVPEHVKSDYKAKESRRSELQTTDIFVVFSLQENSLKPEDSILYTFLPTPFRTGLRFTINCDFLLNTQRSEPDFTSRWNIWLLESISNLLIEVVEWFVNNEAYKLSVWDTLPRKEEKTSDIIYNKVALPLIEHLKNRPCIPAATGSLAKPNEVVIASKAVIEIIPPVMAGVNFYAHPDIKGKVFLKDELGVKDISGKSEEKEYIFQALRDEKWLTSLSDEQLRKIYEFLYLKIYSGEKDWWSPTYYELQELEKHLKKMEIVKATDGGYYKAEDTLFLSNQVIDLVDLPCLIFVEPNVLSDDSRELLKRLGVRDFSDEAVVNRIIDSQSKGEWEKWNETQRLKAISYVAEVLKRKGFQIEESEKTKLGKLILPTENGGWAAASECYFSTPDLKKLLPDACYVDVSKLQTFIENLEAFLECIGVAKIPRLISLGEKIGRSAPVLVLKEKWSEYWSWLWKNNFIPWEGREHSLSTVCLDGFDSCVLSQDKEKLKTYLIYLLQNWHSYYKQFEKSQLYWFHYTPRSKDVPSYFIFQLKTCKWLPTTHGLEEAQHTFAPYREIKSTIGHFFPCLDVSEELARRNKDFLELIGVQTEVNLKTLISVLNKAKNFEVNDALKRQIGYVYKKLASICEQEKVENIDEEVFILDVKGTFKPSKELIWIDNLFVGETFKEDLPIAWVPDDLSKPDAQIMFSALGVSPISQLIERRVVEAKPIGDDNRLTNNIILKKDYLYSALLHVKAKKAESFLHFIKNLKVIKVSVLKIQLKVLDKVRVVDSPCFCNVEEGKLYISDKADLTDVSRELSNVFYAPLGTEFIISFVLMQQHIENIADQFKKSGIQLIPLITVGIEEEVKPEKITQVIGTVTEQIKEEVEKGTKPITLPMLTTEETTKKIRYEIQFDKEEIQHEIEDATKTLLETEKTTAAKPADMWREPKDIEKVISEPKIVVRPFVSITTSKRWEPRIIDGEKVYVEVSMDLAKIEAVKPFIKDFKNRIRKIVEIMGGNPDTANVCIANPETDADRRDGQLFFNILRNDRPLRWIIVVARELAYLKFPNPSQQHINLMTNLIEKAIAYIDEIYPEIFSRVKKEELVKIAGLKNENVAVLENEHKQIFDKLVEEERKRSKLLREN